MNSVKSLILFHVCVQMFCYESVIMVKFCFVLVFDLGICRIEHESPRSNTNLTYGMISYANFMVWDKDFQMQAQC